MVYRSRSLLSAVLNRFTAGNLKDGSTLDDIEKSFDGTPMQERPRAAIRAAANVLVRQGHLTRSGGRYAVATQAPRRRSADQTELASIAIFLHGKVETVSIDEAKAIYENLKKLFEH